MEGFVHMYFPVRRELKPAGRTAPSTGEAHRVHMYFPVRRELKRGIRFQFPHHCRVSSHVLSRS